MKVQAARIGILPHRIESLAMASSEQSVPEPDL
jgi:hypothetical protein